MKYCIKKRKKNISDIFFVIILFLNFFNYLISAPQQSLTSYNVLSNKKLLRIWPCQKNHLT